MPTKRATSTAKNCKKSAGVRRKRNKLPSAAIVSLNLSKCVGRNLTNLMAKLEVSKKHQMRKALINQGQGTDQTLVYQEKDKTRKKIRKMTRKKFNCLGKKFIKEFKYFSKSHESSSCRNRISYTQTLRWLKKAELLDNHRLTIRDVEVHYINKLKTGYELKVLEFIRFLKSLCEDRGLEMPTVIFKLLKCRKPTKFIKKKKVKRCSKNLKKNKETPRIKPPEKKVSTINALVEKSKVKVLNNVEKIEIISKATSAVVPKKKDSLVLPSDYVRKTNSSGEKANKIKGCSDSDANFNPLCCLREFSKICSEENFTNPLRYKTIAQNEHIKSFNKNSDLENIVSIEAIPTFYPGEYPMSAKKAVELIPTALKSISPQTSPNKVNDNDSRKLEMISTAKKFQNSASHNYKSPNVKKTKPNRHNAPVAMKLNAVVVNKNGELKNPFTEEARNIVEVQTKEESYEYIDSDEAGDSMKDKAQPLHNEAMNIKKVDGKTGGVNKSRKKKVNLDKEASEIVSIQHFDAHNVADDCVKLKKRSFEIIPKINKTIKKKSKFSAPSKGSSLSKIRNCMERIFSGELSGKMEENIKQLENENKKMSSNRKVTPSKPRLQSELKEPHKNLIKSARGEKNMKDQKNFRPNIKKTGKNETENSSLNECMLIQPTERKRKLINNKRTFTNLPVKYVKKCLQKPRKEKMLNNENDSPISKFIEPTSGRKITSNKKHAMPTKCDTIKSKLMDGTRSERGSEIQNSNTDADISKSETGKHGMVKKKTAIRHKIRKGVHLSKNEFEDPVTEIQQQKLTEA